MNKEKESSGVSLKMRTLLFVVLFLLFGDDLYRAFIAPHDYGIHLSESSLKDLKEEFFEGKKGYERIANTIDNLHVSYKRVMTYIQTQKGLQERIEKQRGGPVSEELLMTLAGVESTFNRDATSRTNVEDLFQMTGGYSYSSLRGVHTVSRSYESVMKRLLELNPEPGRLTDAYRALQERDKEGQVLKDGTTDAFEMFCAMIYLVDKKIDLEKELENHDVSVSPSKMGILVAQSWNMGARGTASFMKEYGANDLGDIKSSLESILRDELTRIDKEWGIAYFRSRGRFNSIDLYLLGDTSDMESYRKGRQYYNALIKSDFKLTIPWVSRYKSGTRSFTVAKCMERYRHAVKLDMYTEVL